MQKIKKYVWISGSLCALSYATAVHGASTSSQDTMRSMSRHEQDVKSDRSERLIVPCLENKKHIEEQIKNMLHRAGVIASKKGNLQSSSLLDLPPELLLKILRMIGKKWHVRQEIPLANITQCIYRPARNDILAIDCDGTERLHQLHMVGP